MIKPFEASTKPVAVSKTATSVEYAAEYSVVTRTAKFSPGKMSEGYRTLRILATGSCSRAQTIGPVEAAIKMNRAEMIASLIFLVRLADEYPVIMRLLS
jgi:hypothetical protein